MDKSHSERNAHRVFNRYGLALRVPLSFLTVPKQLDQEPLSIPFLKPTDFLKLLLKKYEPVLLGGLQLGPQSAELCFSFWERFRSYNPDHVVYSDMDEEQRRFCVPILVHGDKGRTLQKSPIFVMSFEVPWGLPGNMLQRCAYDNRHNARKQHHDGKLGWSCEQRAKFSGKRKYDDEGMSSCTILSPRHLDHGGNTVHCHQKHNSKGHSYLSRFLIAAITSKVYNRNAQALPTLLETVAAELGSLFLDGLVHEKTGLTVRFAFIACKGDAEFHWEAAVFNRSYHNTGVVNELKMCPYCEAGGPGLSFSDCSDVPKWAETMGRSDPWERLPPLNRAPYASRFAAGLYKFDPFHVTKFGVFRDAVGSCVIRMCLMRYFDFEEQGSVSIASRLERAYSKYKLWTLACGKNTTLKRFSRANFNFERFNQYPWVNGKGSEITLLLMWVDFYIDELLRKPLKCSDDAVPLRAMLQMVRGGLNWIGIMHSHGIWLPRACAQTQVDAGLSFIRGYSFLAQYCMERRVAGFRLRPKLHYLHHLVMEAQSQLQGDASWVLNCAVFLCEQNEDFIGRLARVSRRVAAATAGLRTTQRYLVKVRFLLERLLPSG